MAETETRNWMVATALMTNEGGQLLLVENQRQNGGLDWSPPGGVVDPGETVLDALGREVVEETGLEVSLWSPLAYVIEVEFAQRAMTLRVEAYVALSWAGDLAIDDPDGIVQQAVFAGPSQVPGLLKASPPWVHEPLSDWIATTSPCQHAYIVGDAQSDFAVSSRSRKPLQP
jgi:8-oxo-dGTP diphosphatase